MGFSKPFEDPECSVPACFLLSSGLVTITSGASSRGSRVLSFRTMVPNRGGIPPHGGIA